MFEDLFPIVLSLSPVISRRIAGEAEVGYAYQAQCVAAWRACGFRVISVNAAPEVPLLRAFYPDIEIAVADRDMSAICGKPLVPLSEMVSVLRQTGSPVGGIVNSDVFVPPCDVTGWIRQSLEGTPGSGEGHDCLFLNRQEVSHPVDRDGPTYNFGFDTFFCKISALETIACDPFTIGLPWWDYFLPMAFILEGYRVAQIDRLPLRHLSHPHKWNADNWLLMLDAFRNRFRRRFAHLAADPGSASPSMVGLMHEDRMVDFFANSPIDRRVDDPGFNALRRYREAYSVSVADLIFQMSDVVHAPSNLGATAR